MYGLSYWFLPAFSGAVWLGLLLGLLIGWTVDEHGVHYASMSAHQSIAYISNVGAAPRFKPVFIALCCVTTATLDLSFLADRWLRHSGRLTPNGSTGEKALGVLTVVFALVGTAGLILLSIFDVAHHKALHDAFLLVFLAGYVLSAVFICWEYQQLGRHNRHLRILQISFWIKMVFIVVEVILAIAFVSLNFTHKANPAAVIEWVIAFIFSFYILSFCVDLYPAVHTRHRKLRYGGNGNANGNEHGNGTANANGFTHGTSTTLMTEENYIAPAAMSAERGGRDVEGANGGYGWPGRHHDAGAARGGPYPAANNF
ncbi:fk506 suppressor [Niveomyces insectorum RCEF 264]|uniref:Fk506 suppressor n=1 Tax=Niveomyces insectorum RCEF 264 TaxID=1081102 RepID=A0A167X4I4_9HYPO|nr:fk506 suppressor [Niveomyces insectorum RCEF 264]